VGLAIINVTRFIIQSITIINCGKDYKPEVTQTFSVYNHSETPTIHWNSAMYLRNCTSVLIINLTVITDADVNGLLLVNMKMKTEITNLTVKINMLANNNRLFTNGILVYYYDDPYGYNILTNISVNIQNFTFATSSSYTNTLLNALSIILTQINYNVSIRVSDSIFHDLFDSSILYYYGESCGVDIWNHITFNSCIIKNTIGKHLK